jgi:septal ring factor EnvC (AmiA/AmiB activator)
VTARPNTAAAVAALSATMEALAERVKDDNAATQQHLAKINAGLAKISDTLATADDRIKSLERDMQEVKPVAMQVRDWRAKALGGLMVLGALGSVVLFMWEALKSRVVEYLTSQ